jgi:hypothetical protein
MDDGRGELGGAPKQWQPRAKVWEWRLEGAIL